MSQGGYAELFQILLRQLRKNRLVNLVRAECRLVLFEAKAPQPSADIHMRPQRRPDGNDRPAQSLRL